jgi:divalent metal cation (Fe/Co/Zn/Cd) transporter
MTSNLRTAAPSSLQQIQRIQAITIAWMSVEAGISLWAAGRARSPALLAFGGDSAIELLSATGVRWRFQHHLSDERAERRAAQIAGGLLFVLALFVIVTSVATLLGNSESGSSYVGIVVLIAASLVMP